MSWFYLFLFAVVLTALIGVWQLKLRCKVLGCETPKGKYCGYCGRPQ